MQNKKRKSMEEYKFDPIGFVQDNFQHDLKEFQKEILFKMLTQNSNIFITTRQMSKTTLIAWYCAWLLIFEEEKNIYILTNLYLKNKIRDCIIIILTNLEKQPIRERTAPGDSIYIKNNRLTLSDSSFWMDRIDYLFVDEAYFVQDIEKILSNLKRQFTPSSKKFLLTSLGKEKNSFTSLCKKENYDIYPWYLDPQKDDDWYEEMRRNINDEEIFNAEIECKFPEENKKNKEENINFRINDKTKEKLEIRTKNLNLSKSDYIRNLIEQDYNRNEK